MARITTYALDSNISLNDKLVGTDADDNSITKNYSIDALGDGLIELKNIITGAGTLNTIPVFTPDGQSIGNSLITQTTSPDVVTIGSRFIVSPNSILGLEVSQGAGKALVTISDNLKVEGTYYDAASDEGTDGDVLLAKGTPGNMVTRWTSLANAGITSGIETTQITITDAQIRTLGTVPVEILPGVTGYIYEILGVTTTSINTGGLGSAYDWLASGNGVFYGQGFQPTQHRVEIPTLNLPGGGPLIADSYIATPLSGTFRHGSGVLVSTTLGIDPTIPVGETPEANWVVNITYRLIQVG